VPLPRPLELGNLRITHRDYTILRLRDAAGVEGVAWGYSRGADVASTLRRNFLPLLLGNELAPGEDTWRRLYESNRHINQAGIFLRALSLVDIALWELQAARENKSLAALLGAKAISQPITAAACYPLVGKRPHDDAIEAAELVRRGYPSIKLCAADGGKGDTARLRAIREAIGPNIELKVDVHWLWSSAADAKPVLREWEKLNVAWIEDAFSSDDLPELLVLRQMTSIPLAFGDEQNGRVLMEQLISLGTLSVLRLDATVVGGLTEFIRLGRRATAAGLCVSGHIFEEYHTAALGMLDDVTNIERFEPDSGLDAIDQLRRLTPEGCRWDWEAVHRHQSL